MITSTDLVIIIGISLAITLFVLAIVLWPSKKGVSYGSTVIYADDGVTLYDPEDPNDCDPWPDEIMTIKEDIESTEGFNFWMED
jgi:hypothetical protein